jgi:hypothetical protein
MKITILGWGSLGWQSKSLALAKFGKSDGQIYLEFARISNDAD